MEEILKKEIFFIRHAETLEGSFEDRSKCDINLSEIGVKQANLLSDRFEGAHFDHIYTSPMIRCVRTAAIMAKKLYNPPSIIITPALMENGTLPDYNCPDLSYFKKYYNDIEFCNENIYEFKTNSNSDDLINDERAYALAEFFKRKTKYGEKTVVFCHGSFGNYFIPATVKMKRGDFILSISHTSVTKIKYTSDGKSRISFLNDISHLRPIMKNYEFDT